MKRTLALAGLMLASAGVVIMTPAADATPHAPATCPTVVEKIMNDRVAELGTDVPWHAIDMTDALGVTSRSRGVEVSRETPCDRGLILSVINHEWMHTRQYKIHKAGTMTRVWMEKVADCGSQLLGSTHTPYLDQWGPCTTQDLTDARNLIELPAHIDS